MSNYQESSFSEWAPELIAQGYDCTLLTKEQMDIIGCAAERASLDWEWQDADDEGCEDRAKRIRQARAEVEGSGCSSENEMIISAVGAFFSDWGL